jgi:hypothetical protein
MDIISDLFWRDSDRGRVFFGGRKSRHAPKRS